jgi:hypothetical protein
MKSTDDVEEAVHGANCEAPDAMRGRIWNGVADTLRQSRSAGHAEGDSRTKLLTSSKIMKLGVAAVVVAGALAVGVEALRPSKPNKAYAFSAQLQANTALDLDPKAAIPLRQAQPEDFDVTWDNANGGTLRIIAGSSLRILGCRRIDPGWDSTVSWAYSNLEQLRNSTATAVMPTQKTPFVAVLTSEGNLAVIQVGGHDEVHAWLYWQVVKTVLPGYSSVQIVTLHGVDQEGAAAQECAIDFDSGRIIAIPAQVLRMPAEGLMAWLEQNGVDAIARVSEEGDGLVGAGLVFGTWMSASWAGTDPLELREEMARDTYQPREPMLFRQNEYQPTFPFKTREGAIGMLQLLATDKSKGTVQFRYRMLLEEGGAGIDNDPESQQLAESTDRLMRFGRSLLYYANRHEDKLPLTFEQMKEYADSEQDYQWIIANVEYLGAGITTAEPPSFVLAYDRTLFAKGKGTHVLFLDCHVEFLSPDLLVKHGVSGKPQGGRATSPK